MPAGITLAEIGEARRRISDTIVRTPLVRLDLGADFPDIRLKLENLQPTNSYKIRGAANAVGLLPASERARGVWTISAGNAGQGVAYAARRFGVPETAAPAAASFAAGFPQEFKDWQASFVDGAGGRSMFPRMWARLKPLLQGSIVVTLNETKSAMRLLAERSRIIAEGAAALSVAAALRQRQQKGPIVAVISGGNVDLEKFCDLIGSAVSAR
jgi:threonine dehydratase